MIFTRNEDAALNRVKSIARKYNCLPGGTSPLRLQEMLSSIPVTTKLDLVKYGRENAALFLEQGMLFSETSGSTGEPLLTPRSAEDLLWNTNNQMTAYKRHLQAGFDRVAIIHPGVLSPFVEASALALNRLGVGFVRLYPVPKVCDYRRMLSVLRKNEITTIMSTPSLVYKLLYELSVLDVNFNEFPVKKFLLTGEVITEENINNIKRIVGKNASVVPFVYGSSESATLMIGTEFGYYEAIKEDFVFELVNPRTNEPVSTQNDSDEYSGKLLVTWLRNGLLPILRYDTNDIFKVKVDNSQEQWRVAGRARQDESTNLSDADVETMVYSAGSPVFHYCCEIKDDRMTVTVISVPGCDKQDVETRMNEHVRSFLNASYDVEVVVNPENHAFYDFSIAPKMKKFIITS